MSRVFSREMNPLAFDVHKFGGTSVGSAERYKGVAKLIAAMAKDARLGIVVSAMKGATDQLLDIAHRAQQRDGTYLEALSQLHAWHVREADLLLEKESSKKELLAMLERDVSDLRDVLRGIWLLRESSERSSERLAGYGEVWSAQFLEALLRESGEDVVWLDAREVLEVEPAKHQVVVDWERSKAKISDWLAAHPKPRVIVITGFVASTKDGVATTLGRNGSDFSASIFGSLLDAREIVIWTDVDGVLSADPRRVPEAEVLAELSYQEVTELAYFGAKVVHPATMEPAVRKNIPIWIRNTFRSDFPGTKIHGAAKGSRPVKGISTMDDVALLSLEGLGMRGVPGIAERLFSSLRSAEISVILISQASSEQSICFAVKSSESHRAKGVIERDFASELHRGVVERVDVVSECSIVAAVGDGMAEQPGLAGRFFSALGQAGVSVHAIAQGSSERNISAVIAKADSTRALRAAHSAFYLSNLPLVVGVIGTGLIGKAFLRQVNAQRDRLRKERNVDVRVSFVATSKKMVLLDEKNGFEQWEEALTAATEPFDVDRALEHLARDPSPHRVIIDSTASDDIAARYTDFLARGLHVITPNKRANTSTQSYYDAIRKSAASSQRHFLYSTNVGAGLPVLRTLRDLVNTGDEILEVQGIMSGTLSYLFNNFSGEEPFSALLRRAIEMGYTEPDARDDLSGMDVARKVVILAREAGVRVELSQVSVQNLVPAALLALPLPEFMNRLSELDAPLAEILRVAREKNAVPRYVGRLDPSGNLKVAVDFFTPSHVFHGVSGTDNVLLFRTRRYDKQPLVIRGPGAGTEVTAGGVFADFLRLSTYLGARP